MVLLLLASLAGLSETPGVNERLVVLSGLEADLVELAVLTLLHLNKIVQVSIAKNSPLQLESST